MTTYNVYLRDRKDPVVIDADHMTIDRGPDGHPQGFDFVRRNPQHSNISIEPVRVLYAMADRVDAVEPRGDAHKSDIPSGSSAPEEASLLADIAKQVLKDFREMRKP